MWPSPLSSHLPSLPRPTTPMPPVLLFLLFLLPLIASTSSPAQVPPSRSSYGLSYSIDCGGISNFTSDLNRQWLSDRYFSGGAIGTVAEPQHFTQPQERTLRFFPPNAFGKKSCYSIPVPHGRYYLRTFTVYDNYDSKMRNPSFDVSIEGTLVFSWRSPWPEPVARSGAYADLFFPAVDGSADLCFYSIATDPPVVASIEIFQIDPLAYDGATAGSGFVLVNYGRLSCGSALFGPGFTNHSDLFDRVWQSDADFRDPKVKVKVLSSGGRKVLGSAHAPNYFPPQLYLTAVTTEQSAVGLEYLLQVDTRLDYMVWFHFAEIDSSVNAAGQRVFDIFISGKNVSRIDIFKAVGGFAAFDWHYVVKNLTTSPLSLKLVPVVGKPIICGLENYAMVPVDLASLPSQASAMRALKESLRIPDRMGWNGDPCAPATWDAWEGVTCHRTEAGLVITQLDLGSQGLKGYISDQISQLSNLVSLNLSSNSLNGELPSGLGQKSLIKLDLSGNQFTGSIPENLGSSNLQLVLLNDNELEGQVPERLYSVGVHGGVIEYFSVSQGTMDYVEYLLCQLAPSFGIKGSCLLEERLQFLYHVGFSLAFYCSCMLHASKGEGMIMILRHLRICCPQQLLQSETNIKGRKCFLRWKINIPMDLFPGRIPINHFSKHILKQFAYSLNLWLLKWMNNQTAKN